MHISYIDFVVNIGTDIKIKRTISTIEKTLKKNSDVICIPRSNAHRTV